MPDRSNDGMFPTRQAGFSPAMNPVCGRDFDEQLVTMPHPWREALNSFDFHLASSVRLIRPFQAV
jgi:hypothetical protein